MSVNTETIARIRNRWAAKGCEHPMLYDRRDVDMVGQKDWWVERFVLTTKSEELALAALDKAMKWRKAFGVNDLTADTFPLEMYRIGEYVAPFAKDREGRPVLWGRGVRHRKCAEWTQLQKQFIVYNYERLDREYSHQGWLIVNDSTGTGLSSVDKEFSDFEMEIIQQYYPLAIKHLLVVDLPWILNATAKVLVSFMNEHLKAAYKSVKASELTQYIAPEFIPTHLKGTYSKPLVEVPEGVRPLDQHKEFTADQIKKILNTYKSELK
jgi:hypothetical protein